MLSLNKLPLLLELQCSKTVVVIYKQYSIKRIKLTLTIVISFSVTLGDVALATVSSLVAMSEARDRSNTHVLGSEVFVLEIIVNLSIVHVMVLTLVLLLFQNDLVELLRYD